MRDMHVAIISQRKEFSRFFELEALNFGFQVSVFNESNADLSGVDLCIVDAEMNTNIFDSNVATVLAGDDKDGEHFKEVIRMPYPTSLKELQRLYTSIMLGKGSDDTASNTVEDEKIFFYKARNNLIRYCGEEIRLSEYELKLLECLCRSAKTPVSRDELNSLLGANSGNIADVYVCKLRKKLETVNSKKIIFTVRTQGYKIMVDMEWK